MKVGDLVRLSESFSNSATIQDWGFGIIEKVHTEYWMGQRVDNPSVEVAWPQKSWSCSKIPGSRVEVVNETNLPR